ncbi:MAG: hypothetical protein KME13_11555 [Myxacorys californica WJT36-NPBG1]|nr:hypothetical protein [Myxacorys californica WJT36-NPBG1]
MSSLSEAIAGKNLATAISQMQEKIDAIHSNVLRQAESPHNAVTPKRYT